MSTDADRQAAIMRALAPRDLGQPEPEPPVSGLAPANKPVSDYTESEREALHRSFDRTMREVAKRDEREAKRRREQASRTPEERHNDHVLAALRLADKRSRDLALIRALHPESGR